MGTGSVLFDVLKVKQLNAIEDYIKIKETFFIIIFCKLRSNFLSEITKNKLLVCCS